MSESLPLDVGTAMVASASTAFVDSMTTGFGIGARVILFSMVIVFMLIPMKTREAQAVLDAEPATVDA